MGLRPSIKSEVNNNDGIGDFNQTNSSPSGSESEGYSGSCGSGSSPSNSGGIPSSSSASSWPPATPQREAWTARGQLLLNFHHAISRAINSPEMLRKCAQIAEDMSRGEEMGQPSLPVNRVADAVQPTQRPIPSSTHASPSSMAEEYGAEAALIVENKSRRDAAVRDKSLALGLFTFVALRSGRGLSTWMRKAVANRSVARPHYQFDMSATAAASSSSKAVESNVGPSKLRRFLRLSLDVTISTSVTLLSGAFLFMPKPSAYIEDMSKLPLVEGKSVYAEMVCPPLLKEYRRVMEQYGGRWPVMGATSSVVDAKKRGDDVSSQQQPQLTQEDVSLNVIRTFVENCSKRSKYEVSYREYQRALVEERHALSPDGDRQSSAVSRLMRRMTRRGEPDKDANKLGTISIPSPGVPKNIAVDVDQDVFSLATDDADDEREEGGENASMS